MSLAICTARSGDSIAAFQPGMVLTLASIASFFDALLEAVNARHILTSYSTDGMIPLDDLLRANVERGHVSVAMQGYKRYRVSSQRFSKKPMNVEFVLSIDTREKSKTSAEELRERIAREIVSITGVHMRVNLSSPRTLPRSTGKASRVIDRRQMGA